MHQVKPTTEDGETSNLVGQTMCSTVILLKSRMMIMSINNQGQVEIKEYKIETKWFHAQAGSNQNQERKIRIEAQTLKFVETITENKFCVECLN